MLSICQLFYVSTAARPYENKAIQDILQISRRNNQRLDITGCLLFSGRYFAQVLEGSDANVTRLAQRIALDPRHTGVVTLMEGHRIDREFGAWSMGYLHDLRLEDDLQALLFGRQLNQLTISDVMSRMKPDTVMGALQ